MNFKIKDDLSTKYFGTVLNFVDKVMRTIEYGMFDENGNEILDETKWYSNTRVQAPEDVIKRKKGNCVDQVNLEYWFFKENGIKTKIYYIEYDNRNGELPSHMFVVLENNGSFYWYENAWKEYAGLHEYSTLNECLTDIKTKYCPPAFLDSCKIYRIKEIQEGTNPNEVLEQKIVRIKDIPKLYMVSEKDIDGEILTPHIPDNFFTEYDFADTHQERVPFYPSIEQALSADPEIQANKIYNIYVPAEDFDFIRPEIDQIPQVYITGEAWITHPIKIKKIGNLKVMKELLKPELTFEYGDGNSATLKNWQYSILNGNLTKDSWSEIDIKKQIRANYKKKHPLASEQQVYCVVESIYNKNYKNKKEETTSKPTPHKNYVVVDYYGDKIFSGSYDSCKKYVLENSTGNEYEIIYEEAFKKMSRSEIRELFEDSKPKQKGLSVVFGNNKEFNCYEVNVVDQNDQVIDQELCENEADIKYIIDSFKKEYKIFKVKKKGL